MTSNLGASLIQEELENITDANRDEKIEQCNNKVFELLKRTIRPEFLNRIDEIIMFTPLQKSEIVSVVRLQVNQITKMLEHNGITMSVTPAAVEWIANEGYDPQFGARPVKRVIQRNLLNDLSKQILSEQVSKDSVIEVDVADNHLVFLNK